MPDTAFISQNIYLYCAEANLRTALSCLVDRDKLHKIIGLNEDRKMAYTQTVERLLRN